MCKVKSPKIVAPKQSVAAAAPAKTDVDIQKNAENDRLRRGFSRFGLPSLILTSGLGDTSSFDTRGVRLGGA